MGYRDMKLYGTLFDGVSLRAKIGPEVEFFEMLEIAQRIKGLGRKEVKRVVDKARSEWKSEKALKDENMPNKMICIF